MHASPRTVPLRSRKHSSARPVVMSSVMMIQCVAQHVTEHALSVITHRTVELPPEGKRARLRYRNTACLPQPATFSTCGT
eukprot:6896914-Pyramimonas_sp.AAC.1